MNILAKSRESGSTIPLDKLLNLFLNSHYMKFIRTGFITLTMLAVSVQSALAACTVNGKEVPCGSLPIWLVALPFVMMGLGIFLFIFWLWMLIDAIKNQQENKAMWVILIILLNALGAIIYYFAAKRGRATV